MNGLVRDCDTCIGLKVPSYNSRYVTRLGTQSFEPDGGEAEHSAYTYRNGQITVALLLIGTIVTFVIDCSVASGYSNRPDVGRKTHYKRSLAEQERGAASKSAGAGAGAGSYAGDMDRMLEEARAMAQTRRAMATR